MLIKNLAQKYNLTLISSMILKITNLRKVRTLWIIIRFRLRKIFNKNLAHFLEVRIKTFF